MPLMKPEVQRILRQIGLEKPLRSDSSEQSNISEMLESAGLGLDTTLENLAQVANHSSNEGLRVRANETALKLHGALKDSVVSQVPNFTIVINDNISGSASLSSAVPSQPKENPIFLPRQLITLMKQRKEAEGEAN